MRKQAKTIKVTIINPEAIEKASKKFTELSYKMYLEHLSVNAQKQD